MNIAAEIVKWALAHPYLATLLGLTIVGGTVAVVTDTTDKVTDIVKDTTAKAENIAKDMTARAESLGNHALDAGYVFETLDGTFKAHRPDPQLPATC